MCFQIWLLFNTREGLDGIPYFHYLWSYVIVRSKITHYIPFKKDSVAISCPIDQRPHQLYTLRWEGLHDLLANQSDGNANALLLGCRLREPPVEYCNATTNRFGWAIRLRKMQRSEGPKGLKQITKQKTKIKG